VLANIQFNIGDPVRLRSGGRTMMLRALSPQVAFCVWDEAGRRTFGTFDPEELERAEAGPPATTASGESGKE
jgi:uncharacterized protein YodC (DUF2158 family)